MSKDFFSLKAEAKPFLISSRGSTARSKRLEVFFREQENKPSIFHRALTFGDRSLRKVYIASVGPGLLEERMRVGRLLWSNDISAEYSTADNPKLNKQMNEVSFTRSCQSCTRCPLFGCNVAQFFLSVRAESMTRRAGVAMSHSTAQRTAKIIGDITFPRLQWRVTGAHVETDHRTKFLLPHKTR